jgi:hypothetical protein
MKLQDCSHDDHLRACLACKREELMPHLHAAHERTSFSCGAKGSPACVCSIFLLLKFNFLRHELATLKVSRWEYSLKHTHMQPSRLVYSMYTCTYQQRVNPPPPLTPHRHLHQQRCRNYSAANHIGNCSALRRATARPSSFTIRTRLVQLQQLLIPLAVDQHETRVSPKTGLDS